MTSVNSHYGKRHAGARLSSLLTLLFLAAACGDQVAERQQPATVDPGPVMFAGTAACVDCHTEEHDQWVDSHHDLAMKPATPDTVLGDFSGARFEYFDEQSEFYRRGDKYFVRSTGPGGELQEFEILYTFGVEPLQQYLVGFPDGRLQALTIAWDSRAATEGGQRWFHLYPDEFIAAHDTLHWTGREQNWNYMCAECHSTNLQKNYDLQADSFATSWSDINVGCEACHGPGSRHIEYARAEALPSDSGLLASLDDAGYAHWEMDPQRGIAFRSEPRMKPPVQPEACGRCHSRRAVVTPDYEFGRPLTDSHRPAFLGDPNYFADGQIREEVYVYGSFLQSKMYQAGVSCSDCHNPHSARLKTGEVASDVCSTCHLPQKFASRDHHRHAETDVACVDCHMRSRDYMVVDPRRDHSFRVPRPDLSEDLPLPNACNDCHDNKSAEWAAAAAAEWFGPPESGHFAYAFHAAATADATANARLYSVIEDEANAGIVRATALSLYRSPLTREQASSIQKALQDPDSYVRLGALQGLTVLPPEAAAEWAVGLLDDPLRAVRLAAYSVLQPAQQALPETSRSAFDRVRQEFVVAQMAIAERPEAQANLGNMHAADGNYAAAEAAYRLGLERAPDVAGLRINLADLLRQTGNDADAESMLREGLRIDSDDASIRHSLGLLLVRKEQIDEAVSELEQAARLAPEVSRYTYVYAIALNSVGRAGEALAAINEAAKAFPADFDIGFAQVTMLRDAGRIDEARIAAVQLVMRFPGNQNAQNLLRSFDAA